MKKPFESQKRKITTLKQNSKTQETNTDRVKKYTLNAQPQDVVIVPKIIRLIENYNFTFGIVDTPFDSRITILSGGPESIGGGGAIGG